MKLLIDIGNTNTLVAITQGKKCVKKYFIHSSKKKISPRSMKRLLTRYINKIDSVTAVSVVPEFLKVLKRTLRKVLPGVEIGIVGENIKAPIKNKYRKPEQVGQDRLVTAFAAAETCGAPVLVVDFGTAVTIDYVNERGEYEGGMIFPGLRLALEALEVNTALLPRIRITPAKGLLGRDTRSSMNNGVLFGYAAMCDGMIEKFKKKYGRSVRVIATGGDASLVARYSRHIKKVRKDLILKGLNRLTKGGNRDEK